MFILFYFPVVGLELKRQCLAKGVETVSVENHTPVASIHGSKDQPVEIDAGEDEVVVMCDV